MFSDYWPEAEYWTLWQSWVALAVAMGAILVSFLTSRIARGISITVLAIITLYAIALTEKNRTKPDRDYAYFYVPDGQLALPDGKILLHRRATGPLNHVDTAFVEDYKNHLNAYAHAFPLRFPEGTGLMFYPIEAGDWWIDIDPLPKAGQVRQRLNIAINSGRVVTIFSQVKRKFGRGEILCETPQREQIPLCL